MGPAPGLPLRRSRYQSPRALAWLGLLVGVAAGCPSQRERPPDVSYGTEGGQWRSYAGDPGSTRYSPLDQIHAGNFKDLEIAWIWQSADVRLRDKLVEGLREGKRYPFYIAGGIVIGDLQVTPLMVDGSLYGTTAAGQIFALDAGTGREIWIHDTQAYRSSTEFLDFVWPKHRGVTYWRSGDDERIFVPTIDAYLLALDAETGRSVESFGVKGRVDLMEGLRSAEIRRLGDYFQSSPAALYRDTLIVGSSIPDRTKAIPVVPGDVRAYDARTGALKWVFHTVPALGEFGTETWENDSFRDAGAANAWAAMSVDPVLGAVYVGTSAPTNDFYGGHRPGANLFADTLLCLDAESGERLWHQQLVRHGLWDYDLASSPILLNLVVDGGEVGAVVQVTKQGFAFVFDRVGGRPIWPIEERPVPTSDVPGEKTAATQPVPTRPPPFERQGISEEDLIDFTPDLAAEALALFRRYRSGPLFSPPSLHGTLVLPGPSGGATWRGAAVDPETGVLYVPSVTRPMILSVRDGRETGRDFDYVGHLPRPVWLPEGELPPEALPIVKPPYSRITAIDLNRGEIVWQVANGDGPRHHPKLKDLGLPPLGSGAPTGVLVTKTLLFTSDGAETWVPGLGGPTFRAYDKASGALVGEIPLPGKTRGVPMTYLHEGRQYIVVAVANGNDDPALVALSLPAGSTPPPDADLP